LYVVAAAADDDGDGYGYDDDDDDPIELFQTRGKWWELIVIILIKSITIFPTWECRDSFYNNISGPNFGTVEL